ncbi:DNA polymerase III subunit delta [Anianabacter salinae]|uniref:DNA polymerase III subunit delta n=1 Tax=Anianabacter salinae TaxID=2851023 RepID=UPI00225DF920|nr:DNA polymerase III subunit delta [Anianabacter salinae]MBV0913659.1 DNA polymerase III subunit delta [Anianabacter salinae]
MKLSARDAGHYVSKPDPGATGALIYGQDAMRVALKRQELIARLVGPNGDEEMRLTRMPAAELRREPALLLDAVKAQGFFPGPRVAFVEDATDGLTDTISGALAEWKPGDAQIVVTAGALNAKSALRKVFEQHRSAVAIGIYDTPPTRDEIEAELARAGLRAIPGDTMSALTALAQALDPGDFRQTLEKIALYKLNDSTPLTVAEVNLSAPATIDADTDDMLNVVAEAETASIGPLMQRLEGQGVAPVTLVIMATRHFRALYAAAADPGGPAAGFARARPPVFGPRRDRMIRQAQRWGVPRLEQALQVLIDTDLHLRSAAQRAPQMALVERSFLRLSVLAAR